MTSYIIRSFIKVWMWMTNKYGEFGEWLFEKKLKW